MDIGDNTTWEVIYVDGNPSWMAYEIISINTGELKKYLAIKKGPMVVRG